MSKKLKTAAILSTMGIAPVTLLYFLSYFLNYYTLIGPFCSTAAIVVSNPRSEYCKPQNIFGSYLITVILVVFFANFLQDHNLFVFLAIFSLSIFAMNYFSAFHPSAAAVTIVEFFVSNNPDKMIIYSLIATCLMSGFAYFYRHIHEKILIKY